MARTIAIVVPAIENLPSELGDSTELILQDGGVAGTGGRRIEQEGRTRHLLLVGSTLRGRNAHLPFVHSEQLSHSATQRRRQRIDGSL